MTDFYLFGDAPDVQTMVGVIAIDTETTGLTWDSEMLGFSLAWHNSQGTISGCYLSTVPGLFRDDVYPQEVVSDLIDNLFRFRRLVGHYSSFDARVMFREFGLTPYRFYDTWHIARSVEWNPSNSLGFLVSSKLGIKDPQWEQEKNVRTNLKNLSPYQVSEYAIKDAKYCLQLFDHYYTQYQAAGFEDVDLHFTNLTYQIMQRGFPLNLELLGSTIIEQQQLFSQIGAKLFKLGLKNPGSTNQVMRFLKSMGINPESTSAECLAEYSMLDYVQDIIAYSQLNSNLNARLLVFDKYNNNGRLHSEWHPFGTVSYRMKAVDPNLMAQPLKERDGRIYSPLAALFVPDGKYIMQLDIAQAEVRLSAMISRSNDLAEYISTGDPYMPMAVRMYGKESKENRQRAKRAYLASIYEEGPKAFSQKHGTTYEEAYDILTQFRESFPSIKRMSNSYMEFAQQNGYINLFTGRKQYFSKTDERLYRAFNQEIQGGIAELMREFMFRIDDLYPGHLIGQIHDSVILEFDRKDVDRKFIERVKTQATEAIQASLPEKVYQLTTPRIPLILDVDPFVKCIDQDY